MIRTLLLVLGATVSLCLVLAAVLPVESLALSGTNLTDGGCIISGKVIDNCGEDVSGAEVRLLAPDGEWCPIPDNPSVSGSGSPGGDGRFVFRGLPPGNYSICALKDSYVGLVRISAGDGQNYVEVTLSGYQRVDPVYGGREALPPLTSSPTTSLPVSLAEDAPRVSTVETIPELLRLALGLVIVLAGVTLAGFLLKMR